MITSTAIKKMLICNQDNIVPSWAQLGGRLQAVFDELTSDELALAAADAATAGLASARLTAAKRLVAGPATGVGRPAAVVDLLMARDESDPRWERIGPFEQRWALLVVRIVAPAMDPAPAIADARRRGATWAAIASVLGGVSAQAAQQRFAARIAGD